MVYQSGKLSSSVRSEVVVSPWQLTALHRPGWGPPETGKYMGVANVNPSICYFTTRFRAEVRPTSGTRLNFT
jgi:hypothetical protein